LDIDCVTICGSTPQIGKQKTRFNEYIINDWNFAIILDQNVGQDLAQTIAVSGAYALGGAGCGCCDRPTKYCRPGR